MSEENKEELKEELEEEIKEEITEEEQESEVEKEVEEVVATDTNNEVDEAKISMADTFGSSIVDILITAAISAAVLFIGDGILRATAGYYITEKPTMFMIIYIIVSLLYTSIMESRKNADTIGKRSVKIKLTKTQ